MRKHIVEQIEARVNSMDKECWNNGYCKMCGCSTPALQMANKQCDKPCYPEMMSKKQWNRVKFVNGSIVDKNNNIFQYYNNKFNKVE